MNDDGGEDECQFGSIMNVNRKRGQSHTFVSSNEAPEPGELFILSSHQSAGTSIYFNFIKHLKGRLKLCFRKSVHPAKVYKPVYIQKG